MLTNKLCKDLKEIAANFIPAKDLDDFVQGVVEKHVTMYKANIKG